jgi:alcohol dehydrogenase class IV
VDDCRVLRKFFAPEFVFGEGAMRLAGRYALNFGIRHILLVTDPFVRTMPWFEEICTGLDDAAIAWTLYSDVSSNPRSGEVMAGAGVYADAGCRGILAVGGGSAIDCAKGIGVVSSNQDHILTFEGVDRVPLPGPPLICVPTTAGSAADVSQFAIITDERARRKAAIISKAVVPDISLLDPLPLVTQPREVTVASGMDTLSHAIEAYVSNASSAMTDLHARTAVDLVVRSLPVAAARPADLDARSMTMLASLHAGLAFSNASVGAVHAMAHAVGSLHDFSHGLANALLLEHVVAYNYPAAADRYGDIERIMGPSGEGDTHTLSERIHEFRSSLGIRGTLRETGATLAEIPLLARRAMADPCMVTNPRRPKEDEIAEVYEAAF